MAQQLENVKFDLIRYANCWEDADVLLEGLQPNSSSRILSIGSAGDNSFSLLSKGPELVVAVDLSKIQLFLIELKTAAIDSMGREDYMAFIGFNPSDNRIESYQFIRQKLSKEARRYWDHFENHIQLGIIHQGKFEKYFQLFVHRILPLIHTQKRVKGLFEEKSSMEQRSFYHKHWNNLRWKMLFKIFFSKMIMGRVGRDPEFLKQVNVPVSKFIFQMAEAELTRSKAQENYFLYYTLNGMFGSGLPHYVRPENYERVRANLKHLKLFQGTAEDALLEFPGINQLNLSNIFEYMEMDLFKSVSEKIRDRSCDKARIAYWNLMVPREISQVLSEDFFHEEARSKQLSRLDKGFFYRKFIIDQKI